MNKLNYPTKLKKNIIVDVVFEIRFNAEKGFSNLVPGIAHKLFGENAKIDNYPIYNLPSQVREADPELKYQPIVRIEWEDVVLMIGDYSLGLGYGTNYPGWSVFKKHIQKLMGWLEGEDALKSMINTVERYSFKYVNFIPEEIYEDCDSPFLVSVELGDQSVINNKLRLQLESLSGFGHCLFEFNKPVHAVIDNRDAGQGTLVITDALRELESPLNLSDFIQDLRTHQEQIHLKNKGVFFRVLSEDLLKRLEAQYD